MANFRLKDQNLLVKSGEDGETFRKSIIDNILSTENVERKQEACRRFDIYRDQIRPYLEERLKLETNGKTVAEMMNRATNVNILKKVVAKKARVYKSKVNRTFPKIEESKKTAVQKFMDNIRKAMGGKQLTDPENATTQLEALYKLLKMNSKFKKANRWVELFMNAAIKIVPYTNDATKGSSIRVEILNPAQYDVVEDADNPTEVICFIQSQFVPPKEVKMQVQATSTTDSQSAYQGVRSSDREAESGAPRTETLATAKIGYDDESRRNMEFIFWSPLYYFKTDGLGKMKPLPDKVRKPEDLSNPIQAIPVVFLNKDQDNEHFSRGGEDLVDGTLLINVLLTDVNFVWYYQGMGIFYASGPTIPDVIRVGPNRALVIKVPQGEPDNTKVGFASADPDIDAALKNIEQQVALLLTTNGLEPSNVSTKLTAESAPSGIYLLIEKAEVTESIEDEQDLYLQGEVKTYEIIARWVNHLIKGNYADPALKAVGTMDETAQPSVEFKVGEVYSSEKERLEVTEKRLAIPLDTLKDAVKRDNPSLTDDQAEARVKELMKDKEARSPIPVGPDGNPLKPVDEPPEPEEE